MGGGASVDGETSISLTSKSVHELRQLAARHSVSLRGGLDRAEILERLRLHGVQVIKGAPFCALSTSALHHRGSSEYSLCALADGHDYIVEFIGSRSSAQVVCGPKLTGDTILDSAPGYPPGLRFARWRSSQRVGRASRDRPVPAPCFVGVACPDFSSLADPDESLRLSVWCAGVEDVYVLELDGSIAKGISMPPPQMINCTFVDSVAGATIVCSAALTGDELCRLTLEPESTVGRLREELSVRLGSHPVTLKLVAGDAVLEDDSVAVADLVAS